MVISELVAGLRSEADHFEVDRRAKSRQVFGLSNPVLFTSFKIEFRFSAKFSKYVGILQIESEFDFNFKDILNEVSLIIEQISVRLSNGQLK